MVARHHNERQMPDTLYFAHANSFPASVYQKMLTALGQHYHVVYTDTIGHQDNYPVTDCWPALVEETLEAVRPHAPVHGVGHSLGGVLLLYAAVREPGLFRSLVILDSPLFNRWQASLIWLAKRLGFIDRLTPGGDTRKRRDRWASTEMVHEYFQRKTIFARFDPDCLRDYADHGTVATSNGERQLKFRPAIEHRIYCTLPHNLAHCERHLCVPALYLAARDGGVLGKTSLTWMQKRLGIQIDSQPGSHLFPLEQPLATAERIHHAVQSMRP